MNISKVTSIAGLGGLHKMVAQTKNNGLIVESLVDKKRTAAYATQKMTKLEDVAIYSTSDDVPLKDVFQKIYDKEKGGECMSHKQPDAELKEYFKAAFPEYDQERVHTSDIKKVLNWYNILKASGLLDEKEEEQSEEERQKVKNANEFENSKKASLKDTNAKPVKTAQSKVKAAGVRKTGVA